MKVVLDTNVVMAGLLKDSIVREILLFSSVSFFLPELALKELEKYKVDLCEKSGYSSEEFDLLVHSLLKKINLVSEAQMREYMFKADSIMKDIDAKDSSFIAAALAVNADGIFSFYEHFKKQNEIKVFGTKDLVL